MKKKKKPEEQKQQKSGVIPPYHKTVYATLERAFKDGTTALQFVTDEQGNPHTTIAVMMKVPGEPDKVRLLPLAIIIDDVRKLKPLKRIDTKEVPDAI